jgi:D-beta-D-heptose 7-phosphate kinase/D-beta-D-heptose 1-phosphate adenosyltransferase
MKLTPSQRSVLQSILQKLSRPQTVLVIGDVGLDRYTLGSVDRISPEAPVPIVRVEQEIHKLGLAANVADNLRALGSEPCLVGVVGRDRVGSDFRAVLRKSKISDRHLIVDAARRTVLKERIVSERQQLLRVDYEDLDSVSGKVAAELRSRALKLMADCDLVIMEDYAKGLVTASFAAELFRAAARLGRRVLVDPNAKSPLSLYRGAHLLTPNTREAEALSGVRIHDAASLAEAGAVILKATRAPALIITRGKDGMAIFEKGRRAPRLIETYAREVYDVSGAGDTVISVLALALAAGAELDDAARLASLAAAIDVGKRGTATVSRDELATALASWA